MVAQNDSSRNYSMLSNLSVWKVKVILLTSNSHFILCFDITKCLYPNDKNWFWNWIKILRFKPVIYIVAKRERKTNNEFKWIRVKFAKNYLPRLMKKRQTVRNEFCNCSGLLFQQRRIPVFDRVGLNRRSGESLFFQTQF